LRVVAARSAVRIERHDNRSPVKAREARSGIHNRPDISSRKEDIVKNGDGSIDVYFGSKVPEGA
jgi:hypothetical protein